MSGGGARKGGKVINRLFWWTAGVYSLVFEVCSVLLKEKEWDFFYFRSVLILIPKAANGGEFVWFLRTYS